MATYFTNRISCQYAHQKTFIMQRVPWSQTQTTIQIFTRKVDANCCLTL